jgi:hypothetical protein
LSFLVDSNFITVDQASLISITGTRIDWNMRHVAHFNMSEGKILGTAEILSLSRSEVINIVETAYGDDPEGNDSAILGHAKRAFIVKTQKNTSYNPSKNMEFVTW